MFLILVWSPRAVHCVTPHLHLCGSTSFDTCVPREWVISLPQPEMAGCAIQWHTFTKVTAIPSQSLWPRCEERHAVAVLASINDAARLPHSEGLRVL